MALRTDITVHTKKSLLAQLRRYVPWYKWEVYEDPNKNLWAVIVLRGGNKVHFRRHTMAGIRALRSRRDQDTKRMPGGRRRRDWIARSGWRSYYDGPTRSMLYVDYGEILTD